MRIETSGYRAARKIVDRGGQILLPYEAGDAQVKFPSRRELCQEIATAIEEAEKAAALAERLNDR